MSVLVSRDFRVLDCLFPVAVRACGWNMGLPSDSQPMDAKELEHVGACDMNGNSLPVLDGLEVG